MFPHEKWQAGLQPGIAQRRDDKRIDMRKSDSAPAHMLKIVFNMKFKDILFISIQYLNIHIHVSGLSYFNIASEKE